MVKYLLAKEMTRVRFPSPAPGRLESSAFRHDGCALVQRSAVPRGQNRTDEVLHQAHVAQW